MTPVQAEAKAREILAEVTPKILLEITYALQFAYADGYKAGMDNAIKRIEERPTQRSMNKVGA